MIYNKGKIYFSDTENGTNPSAKDYKSIGKAVLIAAAASIPLTFMLLPMIIK